MLKLQPMGEQKTYFLSLEVTSQVDLFLWMGMFGGLPIENKRGRRNSFIFRERAHYELHTVISK